MNDPTSIDRISVEELAVRLASEPNNSRQLIDVREPHEVEIASLDGFENLPLSEAEQWTATIRDRFDPNTETLVLCHHGMRSAQMCHWLVSQGFSQVYNIEGGIDAYSIVVDRSVPRY
ncbi:rhodanese [Oscillatoriales cyanobacterium LEGE 11467]|uniref:Rhodanese n=1 Tax=Zarconia navalis LEGE 11467 TaxID=1828826 RepID=A0A928W165_9CYAN|nr:rhodanese-like domain-containing protein [Zarconia navalis]MBE9041390.1 rhodanese [Zarconia navalis LEGE 11467]